MTPVVPGETGDPELPGPIENLNVEQNRAIVKRTPTYEGYVLGDATEIGIQWKGTSVCFDFWCECGAEGHFDGYGAYSFRCPHCFATYEMPTTLNPLKVKASSWEPVMVELDGESE